MAGSDPKTNRAPGQAARRADLDSDEDPLVELARIVSEDGGFAGPKLQKAKMTRHEQNSRDNSSDGLEAELLQELETAFPVRDEPVTSRPEVIPHANAAHPSGAARTQIAPVRRPVDEDLDPDQLLRSIEEQLSQFERRQANRFSSTTASTEPDDSTEVEEESFDAQLAQEEPAPLPFGAPQKPDALEDQWQRRPTSRIRPFAESAETQDEPVLAAPESVGELEPPRPPAPRSEYRFRGPANADWDRSDTSPREETPDDLRFDDTLRVSRERAQALRFAEPARPAEPEAPRESVPVNGARRGRPVASAAADPARRERLAATFPEFDDEPRASEPAAPDFADVEAKLSRDLEQRLPEDSPSGFDKWQDGDAPAEGTVATTIAPGPSRRAAAARAAAQQRSRSRFGILTAAVILLVVIGGGAAFYLRSSESTPSGPPPVIAAEPGEVRVPASSDKAATETESAGDAVYNRVAGTTPPANEQVVENSEEPREVARIVLPSSQSNADNSVVRPVGEGENSAAPVEAVPDTASPPPAAAAPTAPAEEPANAETEIGPRRVPTFVVKADGSIVATGESGAPSPAPASAPDQMADTTKPIEPVRVPTVAIAEASAPTAAATPASPPPAVATATPPAAAASDLTTRPTIDEPPPEVTAAPAETPAAPAPPAADAASTEVAVVAPSETQPAPPPPTTASGGYLVQLSSQRTMEQAQSAYSAAQKRFPTLLGPLAPQIQEADLGAKGIYYRVKIGPWATRDEAIKVCESLRAAGGSCLVTR